MKKSKLDFVCIGAMRAGTTSLFQLMNQHPDIEIPAAKEVPFFNDDKLYAQGIQPYIYNLFPETTDSLKGTVSPQYMFALGEHPTKATAQRIKNDLPQVKLIAILRHPIERAYSHYNYSVRHKLENRDFPTAIKSTIPTEYSKQVTKVTSRNYNHRYILRSSYGILLAPYFELFRKRQILVLFTEDLKHNPKETMKRVFNFVGVDDSFVPKGITKIHHKGGSEPKIKLLTPGGIGRISLVRTVWRTSVPYAIRKRYEFWFRVWNIKPSKDAVDRSSYIYKKLVKYFRDDVKKLEEITGLQTPWEDLR